MYVQTYAFDSCSILTLFRAGWQHTKFNEKDIAAARCSNMQHILKCQRHKKGNILVYDSNWCKFYQGALFEVISSLMKRIFRCLSTLGGGDIINYRVSWQCNILVNLNHKNPG